MVKKKYEISYLLKDENAAVSLESLFKQYGVEIIHRGTATEMRLAYPIKKQNQAWFGYVQCEADPKVVEKIMQSLKLNASVLRTLVITPPVMSIREERPRKNKFKPELKTGLTGDGGDETTRPQISSGALSNEALKEQLAALEGDFK